MLARERDQGIQNMQVGIHEIQGIFKDIAGMVVEQGQTIQTIENNAMDAVQNTNKGVSELEKAHKKAAANRKNACMVLIVALLLLWLLWWMGSKPSPTLDISTPPPSSGFRHSSGPSLGGARDSGSHDSKFN